MRRILAVLALLAAPALAASVPSLTLVNLKDPVARICRVAPATSVAQLWAQLNACPSIAAPTPVPVDISAGLKPSWGTGELPGLYTADRSEGAFRFTCKGDGPVNNDDPLVYPGQTGAAHQHLSWGNRAFNANSTHASLKTGTLTNCNAAPLSLNRSSYWMPTLIDGAGAVIRPELVSVYYKRGSKGGKFCDPASPWFVGACSSLPAGIAYVFGWNALDPAAKVQGASWYCTGGDKLHHADLDTVFASGCRPGDILVANTIAPDCWDGKRLDSADHRSHMAYADYSRGDGMAHCPAGYPMYIPQEENKAMWTVTPAMIGADGIARVMLSSDHMKPGARPGETLHADYIEAWNPAAKAIWEANCIDKALSCSGGDLGNGWQLIGAAW